MKYRYTKESLGQCVYREYTSQLIVFIFIMRNKYVFLVVAQLVIVILYPAIENTVANAINGTDVPPRWKGAGRNSREFEKNQDSNVAATVTSLNKRFNETNNGSCLIILGTFLCRPLLSIRELIYQTTTAAATRISPFNEQNNGSARAFRIFIRSIWADMRTEEIYTVATSEGKM